MNLLKPIDNFLNRFTMYKVVMYGLLILVGITIVLSFAGVLFYSALQLVSSLLILLASCWISNFVFAKIVKAPTNEESYFITALILFFIYIPLSNASDITTLIGAGVIAMATKYIFAFKNKHIFNPAAASAFIMGFIGNGDAIWWVGSGVLLPFVLILGLLIVRKIRRFRLFFSFLATSVVTIGIFQAFNGISVQQSIIETFTSWPIIFFGTIMLTEPLTTPPTKKLQMIYGAIVGVLFGSQFQFGPLYSTPELALIIGNVYAYIVSPKTKLFLIFKEKVQAAQNTYEYIFTTNHDFVFTPGQYLEWTLPHPKPDFRGNRRFFTIASSPTEKEIRLGVRVESASSSFKHKLNDMHPGEILVASQLTGDFTLPKDASKKLVFIAGGIGITPFRSMVKYLLDTKEKRSVVLFYANKTVDEIAYKDIFGRAQEVGVKPVYILTDKEHIPANWLGKVGRIDEKMLMDEVPDYKERIFYLSGPISMVDAYKKLLGGLGVPHHHMVTDYFPGF